MTDPEIQNVREQIRNLELSETNDVKAGLGKDHPDVKSRPERLAKFKERLEHRRQDLRALFLKSQKQSFENDVKTAEVTLKVFEEEFARLKQERSKSSGRRARLSVKPGITGLTQVLRLRNDPLADFQEWIYYDVEYARHQSIWLDLQILLYTQVAILAPNRVTRFAEKLGRFGICSHSRQSRSNQDSMNKV